MAKSIVLKTKKRKEEIVLPGKTIVFQPNKVTNGKYEGFTLMHYKLFLTVINQLQKPIIQSMRNETAQLNLFQDPKDKNSINIGIPLSSIAHPRQYAEVFEAARQLKQLEVKLKSPRGEGFTRFENLISGVDIPKIENGKKMLYLIMSKNIADHIISIDKNSINKPIHYTKFLYEVGMAAKTKYTIKLYWLISSWRNKGGFRISLEDFREEMGLKNEEYLNFNDLKKRILIPVQKELENKSDIWFNCSASDFEMKTGRKVTGLNFKLIIPEMEEIQSIKLNKIREILITHAKFQNNHFEQLHELFANLSDLEAVNRLEVAVLNLLDYIKINSFKIEFPQAYLIAALKTEFPIQG